MRWPPALVVALTALLTCATALPALAAPPLHLPALMRIASRLSGLDARAPVKVVWLAPRAMDRKVLALYDREHPRDQQAYDETVYRQLGLLGPREALRPTLVRLSGRGTLALYDPGARRLYVRKTRDVRAAVLRELVHALQDQAFNLRRLTSLRRGRRDAGFAASAALQGHAALTTRLLGGRVVFASREPASHRGPRARTFLQIERAFPVTTGARFIARLRNLGGNRAVFTALRRFPVSTKQVFHLDAFLERQEPTRLELPASAAGLAKVREDAFGELDVRALLAVYQVPRLDHVGNGWMGGRTALYRDSRGARTLLLALAWETETDAAEWGEAAASLVNEAFEPDEPGPPAPVECDAEACWYVAGRAVAFARRGSRTALVIGPTIAPSAQLARAAIDSIKLD